MKFSSAMDSLARENMSIRSTVKLMSFAIVCLTLAVLANFEKDPVVVERSSHGLEIVHATQLTRTEDDVKRAIQLMIFARFDTLTQNPELFLSSRQLSLRETEQQELKSRGLSQGVVLRSSKIANNEALVEFDRVIALGDVRSALKTVVKISFEEANPNELNPYGLMLALAEPIEQKEVKK